MKKILLAGVAVVLGATMLVQAQRQTPQKRYSKEITAEQLADRRVQHIDQQVNLTNTQKDELKKVLTETSKERIAARGDAKRSISKMNEEERVKIDKVLTPAQRATLDKKNKERMEEMKERRQIRERKAIESRDLRSDLED